MPMVAEPHINVSSILAFCLSGTDETDFVHAKEAKAKIPMVRLYFLTVLLSTWLTGTLSIQSQLFSIEGGDRVL